MIFLLDNEEPALIPDPFQADDNGMIAVSENLGVNRLVAAYQKGIFPWMKMEQEPFLLVLVFTRSENGAKSLKFKNFQKFEKSPDR